MALVSVIMLNVCVLSRYLRPAVEIWIILSGMFRNVDVLRRVLISMVSQVPIFHVGLLS